MIYTAFFDGACAPINPNGHMGIGAIIYNENKDVVFKNTHYIEADISNSNNVAEYLAFLSILQELQHVLMPFDSVCICGDSKLVIMQINGFWKIRVGRYAEVANEAYGLYQELIKSNSIAVKWIAREQNAIADELSNVGLVEHGVKIFKK